MSLHLGDIAPDFHAETTAGGIQFRAWAGISWVVFFSHPADFSGVCETEFREIAHLAWEFNLRATKLLGLSVDSVARHQSWIADIEEAEATKLDFPIVADPKLRIAGLYDMVLPYATATTRSTFIIDPSGRVRATSTYPDNVGRSFREVLRIIDALQRADAYGVETPADWHPGENVIIPASTSDQEAQTRFPRGWTKVRSYLRLAHLK